LKHINKNLHIFKKCKKTLILILLVSKVITENVLCLDKKQGWKNLAFLRKGFSFLGSLGFNR